MKHLRQYIKYLLEDVEHRKAFGDDLAKVKGYKIDKFPSFDPKYEEKRVHGRTLKKLFNKYADRDFLNSLTTIHWANQNKIDLLLRSYVDNEERAGRDELSCNAYRKSDLTAARGPGFGDTIGLVIKGYITLLANDMDDIVSGRGLDVKHRYPERSTMSGANKGVGVRHRPYEYAVSGTDREDLNFGQKKPRSIFVFDEDDWNPSPQWEQNGFRNEALVDNWKPIGIIVDNDDEEDFFEVLQDELNLTGNDPFGFLVMKSGEAWWKS